MITPKKARGGEAPPARSSQVAGREPAVAALGQMATPWMGLAWINMWAQMWHEWLRQLEPRDGDAGRVPAGTEGERRRVDVPWMPRVETTVVPLRRRDDPRGAEAARVSVRMRVPVLPWGAPADNVISIDALLPRPAPAQEDESEHGAHGESAVDRAPETRDAPRGTKA